MRASLYQVLCIARVLIANIRSDIGFHTFRRLNFIRTRVLHLPKIGSFGRDFVLSSYLYIHVHCADSILEFFLHGSYMPVLIFNIFYKPVFVHLSARICLLSEYQFT